MKKVEKEFWDKITLSFDKLAISSIISEGLFLILGIIMYLNPISVAKIAGILLGVYLIIIALFDIYEFLMRKNNPLFNLRIVLAIISFILGILVIANPFKLIKILTLILGIYIIVRAIFKGMDAYKLKKYKYDGWLIILVTAILLLIFGVFVAINPLAYMDIIEVAGIFIMLSSILEICNLIMFYTKAKDIVKLFK